MKTKSILFYLGLCLLIGFTSCSEDANILDGNGVDTKGASQRAATDHVLTLSENLLVSGISPNDTVSERAGLYWANTYVSNTNLTSGIFTFAHTAADYGEYGKSWDGMTVSSVNDTTNYGFKGVNGSSLWIDHQWGCMAGNNSATPLSPFVITYWSGYANNMNEPIPTVNSTFAENRYSAWVRVGNKGESYTVKSIRICMHPWAYWGTVTGDGFGRPLNQPGDYFSLLIYGVDSKGKISPVPVIHDFVDYDGGVKPSAEWVTVDLNDLGDINYLIFRMETSDFSEYGGVVYGNTPQYFCLDKLTVYGPVEN